MKVDLTEKEIATISLILHTCTMIIGNSEDKNEVTEIINKLNPSNS